MNGKHLKRSQSETSVFKFLRRSLDGSFNYLIVVQDIVGGFPCKAKSLIDNTFIHCWFISNCSRHYECYFP